MIFVTVGTHEQPFNRLVEYMDRWASKNTEEVIIQTGFSTYEPKYSKWEKIFPFQEMTELINRARIVITHGGPSSFIMPLQNGKVPIVVPREKKYSEHVNNHQVSFCREVDNRLGNIILVRNVQRLDYVLSRYDTIINHKKTGINSNNMSFCLKLEKMVDDLF